MRLSIFPVIFFLLIFQTVSAQVPEPATLNNYVTFLASDSLKGRYPGTDEDRVAAEYIRDHFRSSGLNLPLDEGLQYFKVTTSVEPSPDNSLNIAGVAGVYGQDFSLYSFSSNATVSGDVVFAGFGISVETAEWQWNDYNNLDVNGKWVLALKGDPEPSNNDSKFIPYADARSKALFARDRGALGLLLIGGKANQPNDELAPMAFERSVVASGIPVIDLKRSWAGPLLFQQSIGVDSLERLMMDGRNPAEFVVLARVDANTALIRKEVSTTNIIGILEGSDPQLKNEYIVIGAHYDHLGMGGQGSGSRTPDTVAVHYGADDNASGVAAVMALAGYFAQQDITPARSLMFAAFGAEEMGLLGSRHLAKNLPVEKENIVAMINFDMIGRLNENRSLSASGTGTSPIWEDLLNATAPEHNFSLAFSPEGFGASDHASFYAEDIPVLFLSTGAHTDYHTPFDTPEKIDYQGMSEVIAFAADIVQKIGQAEERPAFTEAGPRERTGGRRGFKVTLGIMPDFTGTGNDGLGVGGVTKGGPADKAGMKKGDLITAIEGMAVGNIYDYMNRLKQLKPGQRVNVDVKRGSEHLVLIVDL